MADFINVVIPLMVFLGLAIVGLWAVTARRQDARIAHIEAQHKQFGKQLAVDSFAFAHQARLHNRKISELDDRVMYMAREIRSANAYAETVSMVAVVDPDKVTVRPPAP